MNLFNTLLIISLFSSSPLISGPLFDLHLVDHFLAAQYLTPEEGVPIYAEVLQSDRKGKTKSLEEILLLEDQEEQGRELAKYLPIFNQAFLEKFQEQYDTDWIEAFPRQHFEDLCDEVIHELDLTNDRAWIFNATEPLPTYLQFFQTKLLPVSEERLKSKELLIVKRPSERLNLEPIRDLAKHEEIQEFVLTWVFSFSKLVKNSNRAL